MHAAGCVQPLRLTRRTFTGALPDASDRGQEETLAVLPVPLWDSRAEGVRPFPHLHRALLRSAPVLSTGRCLGRCPGAGAGRRP